MIRYYRGLIKCRILGKNSRMVLVEWLETGKFKTIKGNRIYVFIHDRNIIKNGILLQKKRKVKRRIKW